MAKTEILSAHHLPHAVVEVIEHAKKYAVLSTAYLRSWVHLTHALRGAIQRGVQVDFLIRAPDGSKKEKDKAEREIADLEALGVRVHRVHRLHAKVYLNESEAIISSFNLVGASQESVEMGIRISDRKLIAECVETLKGYSDNFSRAAVLPKPAESVSEAEKNGYCIGCGHDQSYDPQKPLCRSCYAKSARGKALSKLDRRACHACGSECAATLQKPLCRTCYLKLPPAEKAALKTWVEGLSSTG